MDNQYLGFFLSAILITIYAEVWARILKTPATTVLMPTVIPLSGGALYFAVSAALRMDPPVFAEKARSALGLAVALAAGIMVVTSAARAGGFDIEEMEAGLINL